MIFFHISDVLTTDIIPEEGFITKFKLANTYKGVKAVEIFIEPNQIIQLGERQINLSDITFYDIINDSDYYLFQIRDLNKRIKEEMREQEKYRCPSRILEKYLKLKDEMTSSSRYHLALRGNLEMLAIHVSGERYPYEFFGCDCDFDIHEKKKELDESLRKNSSLVDKMYPLEA